MALVKKYTAATQREALEMVKRDLGENAFVLDSRKVKRSKFLGFGGETCVEVSATLPDELEMPSAAPEKSGSGDQRKQAILKALADRTAAASEQPLTYSRPTVRPQPAKTKAPVDDVKPASPATAPAAVPQPSKELDALRAELREVKFALSAFANRQTANVWQPDVDLDVFGEIFRPEFHQIYVDLTAAGVPNEVARRFIADVVPVLNISGVDPRTSTTGTLIQGLRSYVKFVGQSAEQRPERVAFVGPTGVGKTTTLAKLAARRAIAERRPVSLVTIDTYRIAAVEQLRTYAEMIGAPFQVARSVTELRNVLSRIPTEHSVLIDTAGRSPHDLADQYELSEFLRNESGLSKCLVLQATTNAPDILDVVAKYEFFGIDRLAVTKFDETTRPGLVLDALVQTEKPVAWLSAGQKVPEDLRAAAAESLAETILRGCGR
jgi:flagellar biosynthesis protein FlhF